MVPDRYGGADGRWGPVADEIVSLLRPRRALHVRCGVGALVAELASRGVDAAGTDPSQRAVARAATAGGQVWQEPLGVPLEGGWDLIICIDVLDGLSPAAEQTVLDNLCASADRTLVATDPARLSEPTTVNLKPVSEWAAQFARRGFFRRTDLALTTLGPWTAVFERRHLTPADVVRLYEDAMSHLYQELHAKRTALGEAVSRLEGLGRDGAGDVGATDRLLALVDEVIGLQAELAETRYRNDQVLRAAADTEECLRAELADRVSELETRALASEARVEELLRSASWRLGQLMVKPFTPLRPALRGGPKRRA